MKILFDSVYVHNGGGKEILDLIINYVYEHNLENYFLFLLDSRYTIPVHSYKKIDFLKISPSEKGRKNFYIQNKNFESYFCLSNVPPPIYIDNPCGIYFHNDLFFNPFKSNLDFTMTIKNWIKKRYIISKTNKSYDWCVQTELMKKKLNYFYGIENKKIHVYPIFDSNKIINTKTNNTFIYVCNSSKHKNHKRLMDAFIKAANKTHVKLHLKLTLSDNDFKKSEYNRTNIPNNLLIQNIGIVGKEKLSDLYLDSKFLIFPSLNESLGLPLIEAVNRGCFIIASDKEYVKQVVNPSIVFNPYSSDSISEAIVNSLSNKSLKKSELIIENKINTFVKYLLQYV
ncbi:MAG: glycosyltransferase [Flavobacteriaceae bacterium]|jgi:glycosyltransferase involved in cell wall biosynthesis|nr:glycosyltransferase [Flavobacteriaceae bacterium]